MPPHDNLFSFFNSFFEERRRDRAFVYVEERDVIVGNLVEQDDEFNQIRVRLLPERFLPLPNRLFRSDAMLKARA